MDDRVKRGHKGRIFKIKDEKETGAERPCNKRTFLDGRNEKYPDRKLDSYIRDYGMVTGLDLLILEERYTRLTGRIKEMSDYISDTDEEISVLKNDLKKIESSTRSDK